VYAHDTTYIIPVYYNVICDILVWRANNLFEYTRECDRYILYRETPLNIAASVYIAHLVCVYTYNNCYYLLVLLGTHYTRTRLVRFPKYERFSCRRVIGRRRLRPRKDVCVRCTIYNNNDENNNIILSASLLYYIIIYDEIR